jgi:molecular chaperone IbpA
MPCGTLPRFRGAWRGRPGGFAGHFNDHCFERMETMRSTFDFSPLLRSSVGFENLNRLFDIATRATEGDLSFPPYNIEKLANDSYRITMAVAGFARDELDITIQENTLIVSGKTAQETETAERTFLHRGIAKRAFERRFQLADVIKVTGASYENGLLNIDLAREIPEHKKPRKVSIDGSDNGSHMIEAEHSDES